ncbi:MAG: leucine-rich repeat domain-containing protein [Treponema sp.]|nr:leucine-rich repeat domain-containing protein [Treponema sp.]
MKKIFLCLVFPLLALLISCSSDSDKGGSISLSFDSRDFESYSSERSRAIFADLSEGESQETVFTVSVKLIGSIEKSKSLEFKKDQTGEIVFEELPVGESFIVSIQVREGDILLYEGQSEKITIEEGPNKVNVILKKCSEEVKTASLTLSLDFGDEEITEGNFTAEIEITGSEKKSKSLKITNGQIPEILFEELPLGESFVANVEIKEGEVLRYEGQSEKITIEEGPNKVNVTLKRYNESSGSIEVPDTSSLIIEVDVEKTLKTFYRNHLGLVLKVTDSEGKEIESGINWKEVQFLYNNTDVNSDSVLYAFNQETSTLEVSDDEESGLPETLPISGIYHLYASAECDGKYGSLFIEVPVEDKSYFELDFDSENMPEILGKLIEGVYTVAADFKFRGSFDSSKLKPATPSEEDVIPCSYVIPCSLGLDLSEVTGLTELTREDFSLFAGDKYYCSMPDTVTSIGDGFFSYSSLKTIELPKGLKSIGAYAFAENAISEIEIPESVELIGDYAFSRTSLKSIKLPESITKIGYAAFYNCNNLESANFPGKAEIFSSDNTLVTEVFSNCNDLQKIEFGEGLENLSNLILDSSASIEEISIPSTLKILDLGYFPTISSNNIINIPENNSLIMIKGGSFYNDSKISNLMSGTCYRIPFAESDEENKIIEESILAGTYDFTGADTVEVKDQTVMELLYSTDDNGEYLEAAYYLVKKTN